jgi:Domain of unknown function (DUF4388)
MIKGRDNATESLADLLELIRMRRQSGLLSIEPIQTTYFEEGEIYIQAGQPTYAHTGQLLGQQALLRMLGWRQVYFTFMANQPRLPVNTPSASRSNNNVAIAANVSPTSPVPNPSLLDTHRNIPAVSLPHPISQNSPTSPRLPQVNLNRIPDKGSERDTRQAQNTSDSKASSPGFEWLAPRKLGNDQEVLSLPLTRPQRSIYMLVNGHRTIADLSRCMRKSLLEVERLLSELQERGLISI